MSRILQAVTLCSAIALAGCSGSSSSAASVDPKDPAITATIDSLVKIAMEGAANADAERVLASADTTGNLTLAIGNIIYTDYNKIRDGFKRAYEGLERQQQTVIEKHVQVLTPDVAVVTVLGEGTYTDKAGWTSEPVDITTSLVFVKQNGQWRIRHGQQTITR